MAEIVSLPDVIAEDRRTVVELLEDALVEAKAGRVNAIAIAVLRPNGTGNTATSACANALALLGAIDVLHQRFRTVVEEGSG